MPEITPQQQFESKILDRLREDIGKLVPDEVLSALCSKAIEKMFFEPRYVKTGDGYYAKEEKRPGWFETYVEEQLRKRANDLADKWIDANRAKLESLFCSTLQAAMPQIMAAALMRPFDAALQNYDNNLRGQMGEYFKQQLAMLPHS